MRFITLTTRASKIKVILICLLILPAGYYVCRGVENYFYLQDHYFNTSIKFTDTNTFSKSIILQNTMTAASDTVDLSASNLILVFSATWCKPCLEEIPVITKLVQHQKRFNYKLYFILKEQDSIINSFAKKNKLVFETYKIASGQPAQLKFTMVPTTIVCRGGKSDVKIEGQLSEADTAMIYKKFTD